MKSLNKTVKIFIIITMYLTSFNCNAQYQSKDFANGDNYLNNNLDKFIGTWKYSDANQSFTIILKKENIRLPVVNDVRADAMIGFHKFIKSGNVIEDTTIDYNTNFSDKKFSLFTFGDDNEITEFNIGLSSNSTKKDVSVKIEFIDFNHIKITRIRNTPGLKLKPFNPIIIYPQNIKLMRQ